MARFIMMLYFTFACLLLVSYTQADDQWKEVLKHRLARNTGILGFSWSGWNGRRTTTRGTSTDTSLSSQTSPTATSSPSSFTAFQNEALAQTNTHRMKHCASNLTLSSSLNAFAQAYANKLASTKSFQHNPDSKNKYGENLYMSQSSSATNVNSVKASPAINAWYAEVEKYRWASPGFDSSTGHFTQLVWASTTEFGIGVACSSDSRSCYVVANYSPPGNVQGQYPKNVKQGPSCT